MQKPTAPFPSTAYQHGWSAASKKVLRWTGISLITIVWLSAFVSGAGAAINGIGLHFISGGGVMLILGSIQLMDNIRFHFPLVFRWVERIYIITSLLTAIGSVVFIAAKGTTGGVVMDIGRSIYGILLFISAIETYRYAVKGRTYDHMVWSLRLYALAIGSWLYHLYDGCWVINGVLDHMMAFFFYLPNLLIAEIFVRARRYEAHPLLRLTAAFALLLIAGLLLTGTYTRYRGLTLSPCTPTFANECCVSV